MKTRYVGFKDFLARVVEIFSWDWPSYSRGIEINCWDLIGIIEQTFTCSKPTTKTLEKGLKYVKS